MKFEQALLWTTLTVMIGIFVYIFFEVTKKLKDDRDERDPKNKKRNNPKPAPAIPAGKSIVAKAKQGGSGIVSQYPVSVIASWKW